MLYEGEGYVGFGFGFQMTGSTAIIGTPEGVNVYNLEGRSTDLVTVSGDVSSGSLEFSMRHPERHETQHTRCCRSFLQLRVQGSLR